MVVITIYSDLGAQKYKVCHNFHCSPIYLPWSDGPDAMILVFWMLSFKPAFSLSSFTLYKLPSFKKSYWGYFLVNLQQSHSHTDVHTHAHTHTHIFAQNIITVISTHLHHLDYYKDWSSLLLRAYKGGLVVQLFLKMLTSSLLFYLKETKKIYKYTFFPLWRLDSYPSGIFLF